MHKRRLKIPKEFDAIKRFFKPGNIAKLEWAQVEELRREMLRIAMTLAEGNATTASALLRVHRTTITYERKR